MIREVGVTDGFLDKAEDAMNGVPLEVVNKEDLPDHVEDKLGPPDAE